MGIISELISNPIDTIVFFLLAMPGRLMAISAHEAAHGWVALKCGDPTAKYMGRVTLNPLKHLDPVGVIMMLVAGFGWAKPVPVNPRNFRNYRRDDLLVSLAGITMNLIMFCLGCVVMYAVVGAALAKAAGNTFADAYFIAPVAGENALVVNGSYIPMSDLMIYAPYLSDFLVGGIFGEVASYAYQMLMYFTLTNLVLAIFNLIPIPPLDGYHVLNDLVLSRFHNTRLFVSQRASQVFTAVLFLLIISGVTGQLIGWVQDVMFRGVGNIAGALFAAIGLI